jgi:hypothetical protein
MADLTSMPLAALAAVMRRFAPDTARRWAQWRIREWRCGGLRVHYRARLDGGGRQFAPEFAQVLRARPESAGRRFEHAFEWCSGPGFLGFGLLDAGICERLTLADINEEAVACVRRTIRANGLEDRVTVHRSDNLHQLPAGLRFDLVVGNPPNYCQLNPAHPLYSTYREDLRPNDPEWRVHRDFYRHVRRHLQPGALLLIDEIDVFSATVIPSRFPGRIPYDIRPRPAIDDFRAMLADAGLELVDVIGASDAPGGFKVDLLLIRNPAPSDPHSGSADGPAARSS